MKDGKKVYKPKAAFRQVGANGNKSKVTSTSANVPGAIKRKVRSNAGVKRGPRAAMKNLLNSMGVVKKAAPKKVKALGPRAAMKKGFSPMSGNLTRLLFKSPVKRVRKAPKKVKALGPRAAMKKGFSPMSGNLTRMLFKSPVKKAAPKKVASKTPNAGNLTRMLFKSPFAKKVTKPVLNLIVISPGGHVGTKRSPPKK